MTIYLERTCPILRIFDIEKARKIYLGCMLDWKHQSVRRSASSSAKGCRKKKTPTG
ncbi:glyoxalase superfamily protein [Falsochrobactrum tianjinense]|uniref:glyoxalase superfamily protein n=1 Tax=Falsochrobactrum tianjinense TaxID=2706015 RepID=UPI0020C87FEF|nr:glyoxalase superfamily protein [Falsochrobactrum sp. TDYN1]